MVTNDDERGRGKNAENLMMLAVLFVSPTKTKFDDVICEQRHM